MPLKRAHVVGGIGGAVSVLTIGVVLSVMSFDGADESTAESTTSTTSTSSTTTTTTDPRIPGVLQGYEEGWRVIQQARATVTLDSPELALWLTGPQLSDIGEAVDLLRQRGWNVQGTIDTSPQVVSIESTSAIVDDCIVDATSYFDSTTGAPVALDPTTTYGVRVTLTYALDRWQIAAIDENVAACPTAPAPESTTSAPSTTP